MCKVVLRLSGGIGNQFMQYIVAKYLAEFLDGKLVVDIKSGFEVDFVYKRRFQLTDILDFKEQTVAYPVFYVRLLKLLAKFKLTSKLFSIRFIYSAGEEDWTLFLNKSKTYVLDSDLQDFSSFQTICENVKVKKKSVVLSQSSGPKDWCCMAHLRVTDHFTNFDQIKFFDKVVSNYGKTWKNIKIHTNDIDRANALIDSAQSEVLRRASLATDSEQVAISEMSEAKNLLIGYSTFGWCAGFLNTSGVIFCPKEPFQDKNFSWSENKILNKWKKV